MHIIYSYSTVLYENGNCAYCRFRICPVIRIYKMKLLYTLYLKMIYCNSSELYIVSCNIINNTLNSTSLYLILQILMSVILIMEVVYTYVLIVMVVTHVLVMMVMN